MRLRDAKRKFVFEANYSLKSNYFSYVKQVPHKIKFRQGKGGKKHYSLSFFIGHWRIRRSNCAYKVIEAAGVCIDSNMQVVQRSLEGSQHPKLTALLDERTPKTSRIFVPNHVGNVRALRPLTVSTLKEPVDEFIEEEKLDFVHDYIHAGDVDDDNLKIQHLELFANKEIIDRDDDAFNAAVGFIYLCSINKPDRQKVEKVTKSSLYMSALSKNSAGSIPLDKRGKFKGNKEEMIDSLVHYCFESNELSPNLCSPKEEVIKKGKKVRQIITSANYLLENHFHGDYSRKHGAIADGSCGGVSKVNGGFYKILYKLFLDMKSIYPDMKYSEFLDYAEERGANCADAKDYDLTAQRSVAYANTAFMVANIDCHPSDYYRLTNKIADDLCPIMMVNGIIGIKCVFVARSGGLDTYNGNGKKNHAAHGIALYQIQQHNRGCNGCDLCPYIPVMDTVDEICAVGSFKAGDDVFGMGFNGEEKFYQLIQILTGFNFKQENKKFFGDPNDEEVGDFLRTKFVRRGNEVTYGSDLKRIFGKLLNGRAFREGTKFGEALRSASFNLGDNPAGHELLARLYSKVKDQIGETLCDFSYKGVLAGDLPEPCHYSVVFNRTFFPIKSFAEVVVNYQQLK